MFEVGFQELIMIALLALIVLGPEKLPKLAAKIGHWTGRARVMARNLRSQLEQEVSYEDLLQQKKAAEEALRRAQDAPMNFHADIDAALSATAPPAPITPSSEVAPVDSVPPATIPAAAPAASTAPVAAIHE